MGKQPVRSSTDPRPCDPKPSFKNEVLTGATRLCVLPGDCNSNPRSVEHGLRLVPYKSFTHVGEYEETANPAADMLATDLNVVVVRKLTMSHCHIRDECEWWLAPPRTLRSKSSEISCRRVWVFTRVPCVPSKNASAVTDLPDFASSKSPDRGQPLTQSTSQVLRGS